MWTSAARAQLARDAGPYATVLIDAAGWELVSVNAAGTKAV